MKTPKEKAKELVDFYNSILINYIKDEFERKYAVIECVLKAVDELIKLYEYENPNRGFKVSYWDDVEIEIKKLS